MSKKEISFEKAYKRLKEIYLLFQTQEILDIDKIIDLQKEAEELYKFCNKKLKKIDSDIQQ